MENQRNKKDIKYTFKRYIYSKMADRDPTLTGITLNVNTSKS